MAKATAAEKSEKESARPQKETAEKETPKEALRPIKKEVPPPSDPARDSALNRAVQQIEKQFGKGAVMRLDSDHIPRIEGIPSGSLLFRFLLIPHALTGP